MGRLVAKAGTIPWEELSATYGRLFMEGLALLGTRRKHANVMQHLVGYLKKDLSTEDTPKAKRSKQELLGLMEEYRQGIVPLIVPLTPLKHHLNRYPVPPAPPALRAGASVAGRPGEWVHQQVYLNPYPKELMLRNHVQRSAAMISN
jgi:uncharacterized protein YbgA (DUF1722 family)